MTSHEPTTRSFHDVSVSIAEPILQSLLLIDCKVELNAKARMLTLLSTETPHILAQQQFTLNEWSILLTLLESHPHYAPYETLLASLTSLSPSDCRKILHEAQQLGSKMLKRELKPVYRALTHLRIKLNCVCPYLKISLIRELGYSLTTSSLLSSEKNVGVQRYFPRETAFDAAFESLMS